VKDALGSVRRHRRSLRGHIEQLGHVVVGDRRRWKRAPFRPAPPRTAPWFRCRRVFGPLPSFSCYKENYNGNFAQIRVGPGEIINAGHVILERTTVREVTLWKPGGDQ
jgi:hypothetical protein